MDGILYPGMSLVDRLGIGGGSGQPAAPVEDNGPDLSMIEAQLTAAANEKRKQEELEKELLKRMGITVQDRQKNIIADDTPKGFWGKLGKFGLEALAGAAQGRNYTPYSDRMMDRAMKQHQLETPGLREQLDSVVSQKNNLTTNQQRLEKDRQTAIANAAKRLQADKLMGLNLKKFEALQPLRDAQVTKTTADADRIGSLSEKAKAETEAVMTKTNLLGQTLGLTGMPGAAMALTNKANADKVEPFVELLKRVDADKQKNKALAPQKSSAKETKWLPMGGVVDPATGLPMVRDDKGNIRPVTPVGAAVPKLTGASGDAVGRAVAGYRQMIGLEPTIEAIAKKGKFGLVQGAFDKYFSKKGMVDDPELAKLVSMVDSISKFGVGIHGMRANEAAKHLFDKLMLLQTSPETMKAGLDPMKRAFAERGTIFGSEPTWKSQGIDINEVKEYLKSGEAKKSAGEPKVWKGEEAKKRLLELLK